MLLISIGVFSMFLESVSVGQVAETDIDGCKWNISAYHSYHVFVFNQCLLRLLYPAGTFNHCSMSLFFVTSGFEPPNGCCTSNTSKLYGFYGLLTFVSAWEVPVGHILPKFRFDMCMSMFLWGCFFENSALNRKIVVSLIFYLSE